MNKSYPRKAATGLAAVAAAFVSVLAFTSPASAGASITKPQSVTYYQYGNFYTGKCLAAGGQANGSVVQQNTCDGTTNQQWTVQRTDSGYFELKVASSGRCMEVKNSGQNSDDPVQLADCNGGYNQQWTTQTSTHTGYLRLAVRSSGKCLQPLGESMADGASQVQYICYTAWSQEWNAF